MLEIYIDDSTGPSGRYVLAGYLATAEAWTAFIPKWEALLETHNRGRPFKMAQMARRIAAIAPFYEVIAEHVAFSYSLSIDKHDLDRAKARIWSDNTEIIWSPKDDIPTLPLYVLIIDMFLHMWNHDGMRAFLQASPGVDIYIDEMSGKTWVMDAWEGIGAGQPPDLQRFYEEPPRFGSDEKYVPLQAADLWAWWVREGQERGTFQEIKQANFGAFQGTKVIDGYNVGYTEDLLVKMLMKMLRSGSITPDFINLYDEKVRPRDESAMPQRMAHKRSNLLAGMEQFVKRIRRGG